MWSLNNRVMCPPNFKDFGENFFWVLGGIPQPEQDADFEYYIIPAGEMAKHVRKAHKRWLETPGKQGQTHQDSAVRTVHLPPRTSPSGWDISKYKNRWDLIDDKLRAETP